MNIGTDISNNALIDLHIHNSVDKALENSTFTDVLFLLDESVQHHFNFDNNDLIRVLSSVKCVRNDSVYHVVKSALNDKAEFDETIYCMEKLYHSVEPRFNILYKNVELSSNIYDDLMFVIRNYTLSKIRNSLHRLNFSKPTKVADTLINEYRKNGRLTQTIRLTNPDLDDMLKEFI